MAGFVLLLAEQTERSFQAIDLTLIGMRDALQLAPNLGPDDPTYRASLKERLKGLPYVRALFVIGADGFITHDTDYPSTPRISLEDRPYFQAHRDDPELGLHIGRPLQSRSLGRWFVSISRKVNHPDGRFAGVVVAAIEPHYLKRFYRDLSMGQGDTIALLLRDGTLLARAPDQKGMIGKPVPLRLALQQTSGVDWGTSPIDGVMRILGFHILPGAPLIVTAGWSASTLYASWVNHALIVGGSAILVWALAVGLTLHRARSRRRKLQERAHLAQVQRLETMGIIAGGVAHDLGNTVKIARTTFALIKPSLMAQGDAMALVDEADRSLKGAFDIIDRLLAFARRQELAPAATDLAQLISGFTPILRQAAGPRNELDLHVAEGTPLVCVVDPIHLEVRAFEPGAEQQGRHDGWRPHRRRAERGSAAAPTLQDAGVGLGKAALGGDRGQGRRRGHAARRARPRLRAVLHDQEQWQRSRPQPGAWFRAAERRRGSDREPGRSWDNGPPALSHDLQARRIHLAPSIRPAGVDGLSDRRQQGVSSGPSRPPPGRARAAPRPRSATSPADRRRSPRSGCCRRRQRPRCRPSAGPGTPR